MYKTNYKPLGSLLALTLLSGAILSTPKANADTSATVDLTVNVPAACSLTPANTSLTKTINPGTSDTIGISNIKALCNDANGFAIYAVGYTDSEYGNTDLITDLGTNYSIHTGTGTSASNWNMTIDNDDDVVNDHVATIENDFDEASNIPATYTKIASFASATDQSIGSNLTAQFDAYIAPNQPAGTYQGKVKFALVHPSDTQAPDRFYGVTMQTVAQWGGEVAGGQTVTAIDKRDGEEYTVTKLDDGNLWMTKNLRLNLKTANITVENTNNPTEYFMSALSIPPEPTDVWCNDNSAECINKISFDVSKIGDNTVDPSGHTYDEYGAYYNWFTATAGNGTYEMTSGNTTGDICPSGWHLPSGTEDGEYYRLKQLTAEQNGDLITGSAHFVYSGDARYPSYFGMTGFYWTSSADSGGGSSTNYVAKMAWINNGTLNPNSQYPKTGSFTVRCVADRRTMQNVSKWGNDVLQEQTVTAIDERDGQEYTVARLADGKLWMTKNLRLDLQTANITATNTNNPTAEFLSGVANHPTPNNGDWCNNLAATCTDKIQFSTISINDPTVDSNGNSYDEYGVYYNYYTASAGNVSASVTSAAVTNGGGEAAGDICPKNWHLPKKTDYPTLDLAMGGSGQSPQWTTDAVQRWFASPSNYVTSGSMDYFGQYNRGNTGYYWTSTIYPRSGMNVYGTAIGSNYIDLGTYVLGTYFGYSIRCVTE
ncbi:hypothetical protein IKG31_01870 [Candidatus Saccharibacteria bacterium]|nr:hypothetical protein [Candidatus Saccharibacteria bacterium]